MGQRHGWKVLTSMSGFNSHKDGIFLSFQGTSIAQHNLLTLGKPSCLASRHLTSQTLQVMVPTKSDMFPRDDRGPEKGTLAKVTQHQGSDLGFCPPRTGEGSPYLAVLQPAPSHPEPPTHLPELVFSHVVDVQRLFTLRQDAHFHLPTCLALTALLFCLRVGKGTY